MASDAKKVIGILLLVISVYALYYYQSDVQEFLKRPREIFSLFRKTTPLPERSVPDQNKTVVVEEESATIKVVEEASPAVVSVSRTGVSFDYARGPVRDEQSIGTGFIIDGKNGTILTNKHVVEDTSGTYSVLIGMGKESYEVTKVYRDPLNDFAILRVDLKGKELPQLTFGDSARLQKGQTVIAIGNALGEFGNSVTKGIISGLKRGIVAQSSPFGEVESLSDVIQTDAALNPGNSGGPLLNLRGEVVGINVAISEGAQNIGFSIPINSIKQVVDQFNQTGKISRPYLGVEYAQITKEIAEEQSLPIGAFIQRVVTDSPAKKAGLQAGDIVLKVNGVRIDDEDHTLSREIAQQETEKEIEIVVDRDGKELTLKATLKDLEE